MACRSDHMEPQAREAESRLVAEHLVYLLTALKRPVPAEVKKAAKSYYGDRDNCDTLTALLCETIETGSVHDIHGVMYDGKKKKSRSLADWWESHKECDERREKAEKKESKDAKERAELIATLSPRQRALLNLHE